MEHTPLIFTLRESVKVLLELVSLISASMWLSEKVALPFPMAVPPSHFSALDWLALQVSNSAAKLLKALRFHKLCSPSSKDGLFCFLFRLILRLSFPVNVISCFQVNLLCYISQTKLPNCCFSFNNHLNAQLLPGTAFAGKLCGGGDALFFEICPCSLGTFGWRETPIELLSPVPLLLCGLRASVVKSPCHFGIFHDSR